MKVSVIIPSYNSADTVVGAVESALNQSGAQMDIVVVNDGSTDNTKEVLARYTDRIKLISVPNGGAASARNTGLQYADGDFIMFLDSDDELKEGCVRQLLEEQQKTAADIVRFEYVISNGKGSMHKPLHYFKEKDFIIRENFKEKIYPLYVNGIMLNSVCMCMFKRSVIDGLKFRTDMQTAEDAVFSLNAFSKADSVLVLPEEFYVYNRTEQSLTSSGLSLMNKYKCNIILSREIIKKLPEWGMNSPGWHIKAALRPIVLTVDKIRRNRMSRG